MLEKLHLYCNQIEQIAGLQACIALKELNISENQISKVQNLSRQVHLQSLYIAANPIEEFSQIVEIGDLPNLQRLKLECEDYGPCPVTQLPGYKNYVLQCVQNKGLLAQLDCE